MTEQGAGVADLQPTAAPTAESIVGQARDLAPVPAGTRGRAVRTTDPRLVALYDEDNPDGPDHDYFRMLARSLDARTVVDLGCGTGLLTVTLARPGVRVVGVDPDAAMLDQARHRPGADRVEWVLGDATVLGAPAADLVLMSGNVAQLIPDHDWPGTLAHILGALRSGGTLAFDSRNPGARAWTRWNPQATRTVRDTPGGPLTEWLEVTGVTGDRTVTFDAHNVFARSGQHLVYTDTLVFRDVGELTGDLERAGFLVAHVRGGWRAEPVHPDASVLVVEAVRPEVRGP
jgi:SAM-dependent methyltransferase